MKFETYIDQAWADHGTQPEKVAEEFKNALLLIEIDDHILQLARLAIHVLGNHLGRWADGLQLLLELQKSPKLLAANETEMAILRLIQVMHIGSGQLADLSSFTNSDRIKIMAEAGSALGEHDAKRAMIILSESLDLARAALDRNDSANRALAIAGNNLASALEKKINRSAEEVDLMILAAQTGRKFWEIAGTWYQVAYAEYRLTMTFVQANKLDKALQHAQLFLEICQENHAEDRDMFYCYEALAVVERARKNDIGFKKAVEQATLYFEKLSVEHRSWCGPEMHSLKL